MTAQLNHTIVYSSDQTKSARFLAAILGRPAPVRFGPFEGCGRLKSVRTPEASQGFNCIAITKLLPS